jgi:hypothetical protein
MEGKWARPELNRRSPRCKRDVITTRPLAHVTNVTYISLLRNIFIHIIVLNGINDLFLFEF